MYVIQQPDVEVELIGNDGSVFIYTNYQDFIEHTSYYFVEKHVVTTFRDWPLNWLRWWRPNEIYKRYILRDKFGSVFSTSEILHDIREWNRQNYNGRLYNRRYDFVYRATPVPYTGKTKWRFKHYYKRPKTAQERRWSCAHEEYVRGKRKSHMLPNAWDDYVRGDADNRKCWKSHKKLKQWM